MARAASAGELTNFRTEGQPSRLKLAIYKPASVYTARVNQASFTDPVSQVTYDGGSGTLSDVKNGMTMFVGSAAGAYDKGICRIRKAPSATVFYIGATSDVHFADNDYLTIVDDFEIWQRQAVQNGTLILIDSDVAYSDQHDDCDPVPVMGPEAVVQLTGASITHQRDASTSWCLGSTISTYAWAATGPAAVTIDDATISSPTFTFTAGGWYRIALTVTAANGKTATGYRRTFVESAAVPPIVTFTLESCAGEYERGGWEFEVTLLDNAALTDFYDRALVILYADDWYGTTKGSIGPLAGYENVIAVGRIDEQDVEWQPDYSRVRFSVLGPSGWMQKIKSSSVDLVNSTTAPDTWAKFQGLTADKAAWHVLHWRSTATVCTDITLSGDTKYSSGLSASEEFLYDQLYHLAEVPILARPCADRYGRLFVEVDTQYLPTASRSGIPAVMTLSKADWTEISVERVTQNLASGVEVSAEYNDGTTAKVILSKAPGLNISRFGETDSIDRLIVASQDDANTLSGNIYAQRNNVYLFDVTMGANNRLLDICPRQYVVMNVAAVDTERGMTLTNQNMIPRTVELEHDAKNGALTTYLELEMESIGSPGVTVAYVKPKQIGSLGNLPGFDMDTDTNLPTFTGIGFPLTNFFQPEEVPDVDDDLIDGTEADCPTDAPANGPYQAIGGITLTDQYNHFYADGYIAKVIRTTSHTNRTKYVITGRFQKLVDGNWVDAPDDAWYNVYAYGANGQVVATGSHDAVVGTQMRSGYLDAAAATEIYALRLMIEPTLAEPATVEIISGSGLIGYPCTEGTYAYSRFGAGYTVRTTSLYSFYGKGDNYGVLSLKLPSTPVAEVTAIGVGYGYNLTQVAIGYWNTNNFQEWDYTQSVSGNYALYVKSFTATRSRFSFRVMWSNNAYNTYYMHAEYRVQPLPLYRILLSGVNLYNVCPREVSS